MTSKQALALSIALAAFAPVAGAEVEAGVDVGVGYSNNIARLPSNEASETLGSVGLHLNAVREEGRLTGSFNGDLEYISYFDNTFDDDVYGRMDLRGRYAIAPDTFAWLLDDSWGQIRSNPFLAPSPLNVENTNWFSTGPEFTFRFGPRTSLQVHGRWSATTYDSIPRDYTSLSGGLSLQREISDRSTVALAGNASRIEFDDSAYGSDYDRQEGYLRFETTGARTELSVDAGYTAIHDNFETSNAPLIRLTFVRRISPTSELTLKAGQEYSDDGRAFADDVRGIRGFGNSSSVLGTGDPFESRYATLDWSAQRDRTQLVVGTTLRQESYETATQLDRDVWDFHISMSRRLSESLSLNVSGRWEYEKFDSDLVNDHRMNVSAGLKWYASRRASVRFDVEHYISDSGVAQRDYYETRAWLRVGYGTR